MTVDGVPPEFDGFVIPHLVVTDAADAIDFYVRAFGAIETSRFALPDGRILNAQLMFGTQPVWLMEDMPEMNDGQSRSPHAFADTTVAYHRFVDDVDGAVDQAVRAGATVRLAAADMPWGDRYAAVVDPFGHEWTFACRIDDLSGEAVSERFGG